MNSIEQSINTNYSLLIINGKVGVLLEQDLKKYKFGERLGFIYMYKLFDIVYIFSIF